MTAFVATKEEYILENINDRSALLTNLSKGGDGA